ncbi:FAD-dependent monooxygenase fsr3 [Colletotrichum orbiculare MAFF 240422]|uniref:FAD-dependent monooxygenase fsr3 n=1 Tax=Colletotrichum orbiculare (strain 104-T / ATCC 96160 / CBS 514.97 / LARS 414 / MAFF 240422) TaxID=1213857 RepID=N4UQJ0_COLOR|nr:FAD-dependent monooxygenase fsr3 [Colletotrichum orbiculare MAFF 240422]
MSTVKPEPTTMNVVIVGAGMAGLMCALECHRNGLNVVVLEREQASNPRGDFVCIGPSVRRIVEKHWPTWLAEWEKNEWHADISYYKETGELIVGGFQFPRATGRIFLRPQLYQMMLDQAESLGIKIHFNAKVTRFFEEKDLAGVELADGSSIRGDVVIAADGVHSSSYKIICEEKVVAQASGYSVYRTSFPAEIALANPVVRERWGPDVEAGKEVFHFFIGPDCHANVLFGKDTVCWTLVHKENDQTSDESWNARLDPEDAIAEFQRICDWNPALLALVKATPPGGVTDYRLMWRNPQPKQTSPLGRVVQIGDACHSFFPTSANGAVQAMEDGASLAACLRIGGKESAGLSTKIHALLRFERVSCAQLMGFLQRKMLHNFTSESVAENPERVRRGPGKWIADHDCEQYAIDRYDEAKDHILSGSPFVNTNLPKGYTYTPWDIEHADEDFKSGRFNEELFVSGPDE